jgi:hypothetical protein
MLWHPKDGTRAAGLVPYQYRFDIPEIKSSFEKEVNLLWRPCRYGSRAATPTEEHIVSQQVSGGQRQLNVARQTLSGRYWAGSGYDPQTPASSPLIEVGQPPNTA